MFARSRPFLFSDIDPDQCPSLIQSIARPSSSFALQPFLPPSNTKTHTFPGTPPSVLLSALAETLDQLHGVVFQLPSLSPLEERALTSISLTATHHTWSRAARRKPPPAVLPPGIPPLLEARLGVEEDGAAGSRFTFELLRLREGTENDEGDEGGRVAWERLWNYVVRKVGDLEKERAKAEEAGNVVT